MTSTPPAFPAPRPGDRTADVQRNTSETQIGVRINLDGTGVTTLTGFCGKAFSSQSPCR